MIEHIRNFSIIAHIDHGKSTLADRFLEICQVVEKRKLREQMLDTMDLERERGITIKMQPVTLNYTFDKKKYELNLIDTPGHVDFSYEVSRSLAACEGALLVIDAVQGVEAQTLANYYLALESDLTVIPVINKIDLPNADVPRISEQVEKILGLSKDEIIAISAKTGANVATLLSEIVKRIPAPKTISKEPFKALVFDSDYNSYKGASATLRIVSGELKKGDRFKFFSNNKAFQVDEVGQYCIEMIEKKVLTAGQVGYVLASLKDISDVRIGDTLTLTDNPCTAPLKGYKEVKPMVYAGIFPIDSDDYENFKEALQKLKLNDSALVYTQDNSDALGFGFRCGFLGLLHLEIIQERIEREYNVSIITTAPSVEYKVHTERGETSFINNPSRFPVGIKITKIEEPYVNGFIVVNEEFIGNMMTLIKDKRGAFKNMTYLQGSRVEINVELPLSEIIFDFYDNLKSLSKGYASFNYEIAEYRESDLAKMDIYVDNKVVDALSVICYRAHGLYLGREIIHRLQKLIPRHMFKIPLQAGMDGRIIVRENIAALRKDVIAKCYGGDVSRKRKLLEKQKEGKRRMKNVGNVAIPQEAFLAVLNVGSGK